MKVLIVYAHPNPKSFNHAILEEFTKGLKEGGHEFEIVDLYGIDFEPRVQLQDLGQFAGGHMPEEVLEQQKKFTAADALVLIHPMWGWSYPAILKGWLDRIFTFGFAYKSSEKGMEGLLKHSKALILSTSGGPEAFYKSAGYWNAYITLSNGYLKTSGIQNVEYKCFYAVQAAGDEGRKKYLEESFVLGKEF